MSSTTFTDNSTVVQASWLNDLNTVAYTYFGDGSSLTGNITLNTNKFTVAYASGNTSIAGTLGVTGTLTGAAANFSGTVTTTAHNNVFGGSGLLSGISAYGGCFYSKDDRSIAAITVGHSSDAASGTEIFFINSNGVVGSIGTNGTATSFNTSSDERLKRKIGAASSLDVLMKTKVWDVEWIADDKPDRVVMAQEAFLVKPGVVFVGGDDPKTNPWTVDYSKYVPDLIVGWQEHDRELVEHRAWRAKAEKALASNGITLQ